MNFKTFLKFSTLLLFRTTLKQWEQWAVADSDCE